jgi:hypothetical protein
MINRLLLMHATHSLSWQSWSKALILALEIALLLVSFSPYQLLGLLELHLVWALGANHVALVWDSGEGSLHLVVSVLIPVERHIQI